MKSPILLLCSVLLFAFIDCKRYFAGIKSAADQSHEKTDNKILAELGDYEIPHLGDQ